MYFYIEMENIEAEALSGGNRSQDLRERCEKKPERRQLYTVGKHFIKQS